MQDVVFQQASFGIGCGRTGGSLILGHKPQIMHANHESLSRLLAAWGTGTTNDQHFRMPELPRPWSARNPAAVKRVLSVLCVLLLW